MDDIDFMMQLSTDEDSSNSEVETTKQKETIFAFPTSKQLPLKFDPFKLEIFNFPSNFSKKVCFLSFQIKLCNFCNVFNFAGRT